MRRFLVAFLAVPISLLIAFGTATADTSPNGTNYSSSSSSCTTSGGRQVCTDTNLDVFSNEDGSLGQPCLNISTYSFSSNGRFTSISEEFGCASSGTITIGADFSVTLDATQVPVESCNKQNCTSRTVTVAASDSPTGPVSTSTTRSTTTSGNCTTKMTTTEQFADLAGTLTVDGTASASSGFVDVFTSKSTTRCK